MLVSIVFLYLSVWVAQATYALLRNKRLLFTQFNACGLLTMEGSSDDCADISSGVKESHVTDSKDLDLENATIDDDGNIIDIPWLTEDTPYVALIPDKDDTAFFNQETVMDDVGKKTITGTASYSFSGLNLAKVHAAEAIKQCCSLVAVHLLNNGLILIQGIKTVQNKVTLEWTVELTKRPLKAVPNILSGSGDEADRVTLELLSIDNLRFAPTTFPGTVDPVVAATTVASLVEVD